MIFTQETIPFWTAVAAVAAGGSAVMAALYTFLTFRLFRLQAEPKVIVYNKTDPDRQTIFMIIIENIGRDIAYNVRFKASKPIPSRAFGMSPDEAKPTKIMDRGPLIEGIPVLGPGDSREITWGQFGGLWKALKDTSINLEYTYWSGKRIIKGESKLEVRSYLNTNASEKPSSSIAKSLKEIATSSNRIESMLSELLRNKEQES